MFKRWKKDKKFRNNVIIGLVIFFFLTNIRGTELQATWNPPSVEECKGIHLSANACIADGCVWNPLEPINLCKNCVPTGTTIERHDKYDVYSSKWPDQICCSGCHSSIIKGTTFGQYSHDSMTCLSCTVPDGQGGTKPNPDVSEPCKKWMKVPSSILESIWKGSREWDCSARAYVVVGIAGMMLLAVI